MRIHGDGLQSHHAVRREEEVTGGEVVVVVFQANGLKHFDTGYLVELAMQVSVVFEDVSYPVFEAVASELSRGVIVLPAADCRGGDAAAVLCGRVNCKTASAGAYF